MSYLPKNEENLEAPQGQTTHDPAKEAPPTQSGGSVGDEGAGGTGSATGSPTQFGSSASKLGDYLSANAPQIGQQANQVAGKFNDQYSQLNQGITNAANQFNQQVQGGYTAPNQNIVNQAVSNPSQFTATPENIKAFQAQYNDQYTGPQNIQSFQPYSQIQGDVQNAVQQGNLLQNQEGLASYLQGNSKNPTRASSTLDSLLLSGNPEAQKKIQDAGKQFNNLTGQLETTKNTANQSVQDAQKAAQDAATYAQGQFGNAVTGFNTGLNNKLTQATTGNNSYNSQVDALRSQLQSGNLVGAPGVDPKLINFLQTQIDPWYANNTGINRDQFNYLPALASNINPQQPTLGSVASPEDYAFLQALNQLGGNPVQSPLDVTQASQAGTYTNPTLSNLDNKKVAQEMLDSLTASTGTTNGISGLTQFQGLQHALEDYLGTLNRPHTDFNPGAVPWIQ